ncbi:hypothetical protein ACFLU1_05260 [Chloroflexota bacterium]
MPNLRHLLDDLDELNIDPKDVQIPGILYDQILDQDESETDEDEQ